MPTFPSRPAFISRSKCKYSLLVSSLNCLAMILFEWQHDALFGPLDTRPHQADRQLNDLLCSILTFLPFSSLLHRARAGQLDQVNIVSWWNVSWKNIHHHPVWTLEPIGFLLDLCNEYYGCLIRMTLLSSPYRSYLLERSQRSWCSPTCIRYC